MASGTNRRFEKGRSAGVHDRTRGLAVLELPSSHHAPLSSNDGTLIWLMGKSLILFVEPVPVCSTKDNDNGASRGLDRSWAMPYSPARIISARHIVGDEKHVFWRCFDPPLPKSTCRDNGHGRGWDTSWRTRTEERHSKALHRSILSIPSTVTLNDGLVFLFRSVCVSISVSASVICTSMKASDNLTRGGHSE